MILDKLQQLLKGLRVPGYKVEQPAWVVNAKRRLRRRLKDSIRAGITWEYRVTPFEMTVRGIVFDNPHSKYKTILDAAEYVQDVKRPRELKAFKAWLELRVDKPYYSEED